MYSHGFRRYTEDVGILVTPEGLATIHDKLDGLGYVPPFAASKNLARRRYWCPCRIPYRPVNILATVSLDPSHSLSRVGSPKPATVFKFCLSRHS